MRGHAQQQVPVVGPHVARQDRAVVAAADLADQVPHLQSKLAFRRRHLKVRASTLPERDSDLSRRERTAGV
jgi:hypothetical protein